MCSYTHSAMMREFFQYELENFVQPMIDSGKGTHEWETVAKYLEERIVELDWDCKQKERIMKRGGNDY